jgi:palmitoyltransferase
MDHHCPWTSNCVSHTTFPHFLRFVYHTTLSLLVLTYHLSTRLHAVYSARNLPSYLGPSKWALAHLMILTFTTLLLLFALTVLLVTATWSLVTNTTMIEAWEIERHDALVYKASHQGGWVYGPGGKKVRICKQEFPYDVGMWKNLVQGMGTPNVFAWLLPFAGGPGNESGWGPWEENGFEEEGTSWPPIDPDKLPRPPPIDRNSGGFIHDGEDGEDEVEAFRRRQEEDYKRWGTMRNHDPNVIARFRSAAAAARSRNGNKSNDEDDYNEDDNGGEDIDGDYESEYEEGMDGEAGWTNSDGDRLRDYGVDEEAELIVDEDIPLGELLRRRRVLAAAREQD